MIERVSGHTIELEGFSPEMTVVDLGAHRGGFSCLLRNRIGGGTFHLVEANPELQTELNAHEGMHVWPYAVAAKSGKVTFNISKNPTGSSLLELPETAKWDNVLDHAVTVESRSLEDLLRQIGVEAPDLLKMDIEGAEVEVLDAAPDALLRNIRQVTAEFHSDADFGFDMVAAGEKTIRRMRRLGFFFMDFSDGRRIDVLFLNRRFYPVSLRRRGMWWIRNRRSNGFRRLLRKIPVRWRRRLLGGDRV